MSDAVGQRRSLDKQTAEFKRRGRLPAAGSTAKTGAELGLPPALIHAMLHTQQHHSFSPLDLNILNMLTADGPAASSSSGASSTHAHPPRSAPAASKSAKSKTSDRRPPVDPLMVAAAAAAGPE